MSQEKKKNPSFVPSLQNSITENNLYCCSDTEAVADPDPEIRVGGAVSKKLFSALRASVWAKNKGDHGPRVPSLDRPLCHRLLHTSSRTYPAAWMQI